MAIPYAASPDRSSRLGDLLSDHAFQDCAFAALIVVLRIPANLGMPGALACLVLSGLYAALRVEQVRDVVARCWVQLTYPAFALLSIAWAVHPAVTLRASVQMTLTAIAGLLLSQARHPRAVMVGLFFAYAGYTVASLLVGNTRPDGDDGVMALYGLGGEAKNFFADSAATATLLAMALTALCLERKWIAGAIMAAGTVAACALATVQAHSAGAVAGLLMSAALLVMFLALRRSPMTLKLLFVSGLVGAFLLGALFFQPLLAIVQEMSSKDAGLTGRGYLWYRANFIIAERPWLGTGYFGFWTPSNPDAVGLWRYFKVEQEGTAFTFHNSYIQTIVETGYIGVAIMVLGWIVGLCALLRRFVFVPSLPTCFWLSYLAFQISKSPVEPIRPTALIAPTILLFAGLGFGHFPFLRSQVKVRRSGQGARSGEEMPAPA